MSRSRKKVPLRWLSGEREMKTWKKQQNRRLRRILLEEDIPHLHKFSDMWSSPSDGKIWMRYFEEKKSYKNKMK